MDSKNGLVRALTPDELSTLRQRRCTWRCDKSIDWRVRLHDPTQDRSATARTLKLAFDELIGSAA